MGTFAMTQHDSDSLPIPHARSGTSSTPSRWQLTGDQGPPADPSLQLQQGIRPPEGGGFEAHVLRHHWQGLAGATIGTARAERYAHGEPEAHG